MVKNEWPRNEIVVSEVREKQIQIVPIRCQCVAYVQETTGVKLTGDAIRWQSYITTKYVGRGAIIVLKTKPLGHIGLVRDYTKDTVTFESQNWSAPCKVEKTTIKIDDPLIAGYISY